MYSALFFISLLPGTRGNGQQAFHDRSRYFPKAFAIRSTITESQSSVSPHDESYALAPLRSLARTKGHRRTSRAHLFLRRSCVGEDRRSCAKKGHRLSATPPADFPGGGEHLRGRGPTFMYRKGYRLTATRRNKELTIGRKDPIVRSSHGYSF